jgi:1,4-alpha-glucan branching enzyme
LINMDTLASPEAVEAIENARHGDPFAFLGLHEAPAGAKAKWIARCFCPGASAVRAFDPAKPDKTWALSPVGGDGFFAGALAGAKARFRLRLEIVRHGETHVVDDPYSFPSAISSKEILRFRQGQLWRNWETLGARPVTHEGVEGTLFVTWAPAAKRVSVVGPFNDWDGRVHPMRVHHDAGLWEIFLPGVGAGAIYKFEIVGHDGALRPLKADPLAFAAEHRPATASVVAPPPAIETGDAQWLATRGAANAVDAPISIYEVHFGSWRRVPEEGDRPLTYAEMGDWLIPHVRDLGFTHVQFMPLSEHPFDGSWGYQPVGMYAATSRFGTADDLRALISRLHQAGIGVLADFVPAHFPADPHGLDRFDGTALYEHEDPRLGFHPDWKTNIYNFGRTEVCNFLVSSGLYWLYRFKIDGLRVDAVSSMLYLDYSRAEGEWVPNQYGGNINLEAVDFMRRLNEMAYGDNPGIMMVAEESTAWPGVCRPTWDGGLGFGFKWNLGWMHDTLQYMGRDPIHRAWHHGEMTFGLAYAWTENFILALSHDEVVHGKGSLLARMPGDGWTKFANLRAYYAFMWAHPGKKLLFMGGEFAQAREWNHEASLDWHHLQDPAHIGVQRLVGDLNRLYRSEKALHERDCDPSGFQWVQSDAADVSVFAFLRWNAARDRSVLAIVNLTPVARMGYRVGAPHGGTWRVVLNTDATVYGGAGHASPAQAEAEPTGWDGLGHSIVIDLPPLSGLYLVPA